MIRWLGLCVLMISSNVVGATRNYVASIDHSFWQLEQATPLQCVLAHDIPRYGRALFVSRASRDLNLHFSLEMHRKPDVTTEAWLRSIAPLWRPGAPVRTISELTYFRHFNGEIPRQEAWIMLNELENGMQPTIFYQDWYNDDHVAVGLSSANFGQVYQDFVRCLDSLLPFGYEDIEFSILHYEEKNGELTRESQRRVEQIIKYFQLDPDVELVLTDTYTDSYRSEATNEAITKQQADSLKHYLMSSGIEEERIVAVSHGEKRHIASNRTAAGRDLNRRVVLRIEY